MYTKTLESFCWMLRRQCIIPRGGSRIWRGRKTSMRKTLKLKLNEIQPTYYWIKLEARFLMTTVAWLSRAHCSRYSPTGRSSIDQTHPVSRPKFCFIFGEKYRHTKVIRCPLNSTRPGDKKRNLICLYWYEDNFGTEKPLKDSVLF